MAAWFALANWPALSTQRQDPRKAVQLRDREAEAKVGKDYWDRVWAPIDLPRPVRPEDDSLRNHSFYGFHRYFTKVLPAPAVPGRQLIEFGCAQSVWLSYFARQFGFTVTGLDYAERGCEKAAAVLKRDGAQGEIVCADFLTPPPAHMLGRFDVGVSFGVAEHFMKTADCLVAFKKFLKPGGVLITMVPNLAGFTGHLQRHLQRDIYDAHVVLGTEELAAAHRQAGLEPYDCRYLACSNFGVLTLGPAKTALSRAKFGLRTFLMGLSAASWVIDKYVVRLPETRTFSPYVICAARNMTP